MPQKEVIKNILEISFILLCACATFMTKYLLYYKSAERHFSGMLFRKEGKKIGPPTQASSSGASFIAFARNL